MTVCRLYGLLQKASALKSKGVTVVKKVSNKVLRRMRIRQMEQEARDEMDEDDGADAKKKQKKRKADEMAMEE